MADYSTASRQFLYRIKPVRPEMLSEGPTEAESAVVSEHFTYLTNLTNAGVVLLTGRTLNTDQSSFGIVILTADSEGDARKLMLADPAVQKGVMTAEIFPFRVALTAFRPV